MNVAENPVSTLLETPPFDSSVDQGVEVTPIKKLSPSVKAILWMIGILVFATLIWAGFTAAGAPDPETAGTTSLVATMDIVVLVFREGLECVLVLAAITAGMRGAVSNVRKPIAAGVLGGLLITIVTWMVAVGIVNKLAENISALYLQAATGLLAVVVLLVIMNWFLHKVYWGGWIAMHHRRKRTLLSGDSGNSRKVGIFFGLAALGFTSVYREGFEIVLFLQSYRLKWGDKVVLGGALIGLILTAGVGVITFIAQRRLPYRKMLIYTGLLLGFVLLVMVGEQAQEMQLAHWLPTTTIPGLSAWFPAWMGVWFSLFPTVETLLAQGLAAAIVIGSYYGARRMASTPPAA